MYSVWGMVYVGSTCGMYSMWWSYAPYGRDAIMVMCRSVYEGSIRGVYSTWQRHSVWRVVEIRMVM